MLNKSNRTDLVELPGKLWDDPNDGKAEDGEEGQAHGEEQHGAVEEDQTHGVPHEQAELFAQGLAHVIGVFSDSGHEFS